MPTIPANVTKSEEEDTVPTAPAKKATPRVRRNRTKPATEESKVITTGPTEEEDQVLPGTQAEENENEEENEIDEDEGPDYGYPVLKVTVDDMEGMSFHDVYRQFAELEPDTVDGVQLTKTAGTEVLVVQLARFQLEISN